MAECDRDHGLGVVLWVGNNLFDTITGEAPTMPPTDGENPAPVGGNEGGHDPTQFDHG